MAGPVRISVFNSDKLQAAIRAMGNLDRTVQKWVRNEIKTQGQPIWQEEVRGRVTTRFETRVLSDTARVRPSNQNVTLVSGTSVARLRGGARISDVARAAEFGANRESVTTYRNRHGSTITRHTDRQFKPTDRKGYVVYQAFAKAVPRFASLFAQTVARAVYDSFEGKEDG